MIHEHEFGDPREDGWCMCMICGTMHNTIPYPRENYLGGTYWDGIKKSTIQDQRANLESFVNENGESKVEALLKHRVGRKLLEVACAPGSVLKLATETGVDCVGIEPDFSYARIISQYAKCPVITGFFEDIDLSNRAPFSTIIASDLVEHLESPEDFIQKCLGLLEDGGRLILMVPTIDNHRPCDVECPEHLWILSEGYIQEAWKPLVMEVWMPGHTLIVIEK